MLNKLHFLLHDAKRTISLLPCVAGSFYVDSLMSTVGLSSHWLRLSLSREPNANFLLSVQLLA